jgi:HEAT repeat protein
MKRFETLENAMREQDEESRRQAVESLAEDLTEDSLPLLIEALGDKSWRVRKTAVDVILAYPDPPRAIDRLIAALHAEENVGLRNSAVEALIRMGERVVPALLKHMHDPSHDARKFVIDVLGGIGDPRAVPALVEALEDPDDNVRSDAAEMLGAVGGEESLASLLANLRRDDLLLQFSSLQAIANIGKAVPLEEIAPLLEKPLLRKVAYECLGNIPDPRAVGLLLDGVCDRSQVNHETASAALVRLFHRASLAPFREAIEARVRSRIDAEQVARLVKDLEEAPLGRRICVVQLLGLAADPSATAALLEAALSEDLQNDAFAALLRIGPPAAEALIGEFPRLEGGRRAIACAVLGDIGHPDAQRVLLPALGDEPAVGAAAATALGKLGAVGAVQPLIGLLEDCAEEVQEAAVGALVSIGRTHRAEVLRRIKPCAGEGTAVRRANAVRILGDTGGEEGVEAIQMAVKDENPLVRRTALEALGRIDFARFEEIFVLSLTDESSEVRQLTAELWGASHHSRVIEKLAPMLDDEDLWVRCAAIRGLGESGDASAVALLRSRLGGDGGMEMIAALESLVRVGGEAAQEDLCNALRHRDGEVARTAVDLLESMEEAGSGAVTEQVAELLWHENAELRLTAARFLGNRQARGALPSLLVRWEEESDQAVREAIHDAIQRLGGPPRPTHA